MLKIFNNHNIFIASIVYITIPVILFLFNWVSFAIGTPLCGFVCVFLYKISQEISQTKQEILIKDKKDKITLIILSFTVLIILISLGIGGFTNQSSDYIKHNGIFRLLLEKIWPVKVTEDSALVYYMGYYLLPSLVGKIFNNSFFAVQIGSLIFAYFGIMLVMFNIWLAKNKFILSFFFVFFLFDGFDLPYYLIVFGDIRHSWYAFEWSRGSLNYTSVISAICWVPQHAIAAWLGTMLIINKKLIKFNGFILSGIFFFSPFVVIGLIPFACYNACFALKNKDFKLVFNYYNFFAAMPIMLILALYFTSNTSGNMNISGFITDFMSFKNVIINITLFTFFNVILWVLVLDKKAFDNHYLIIGVILLILLPVYRLGIGNDWVTRVSHPSLLIIMLALMDTFSNAKINKKIVISVMLTITFWNGVMCFSHSLYKIGKFNYKNSQLINLPKKLSAQYIAKDYKNTLFYKISAYP